MLDEFWRRVGGSFVHHLERYSFMIIRTIIGCAGATFMTNQFWCSLMFAPNIAGTANATADDWGNLGGGVGTFDSCPSLAWHPAGALRSRECASLLDEFWRRVGGSLVHHLERYSFIIIRTMTFAGRGDNLQLALSLLAVMAESSGQQIIWDGVLVGWFGSECRMVSQFILILIVSSHFTSCALDGQ